VKLQCNPHILSGTLGNWTESMVTMGHVCVRRFDKCLGRRNFGKLDCLYFNVGNTSMCFGNSVYQSFCRLFLDRWKATQLDTDDHINNLSALQFFVEHRSMCKKVEASENLALLSF